MRLLTVVFATMTLLLARPALGDTVRMFNGDRYDGEILYKDNNSLIIKLASTGERKALRRGDVRDIEYGPSAPSPATPVKPDPVAPAPEQKPQPEPTPSPATTLPESKQKQSSPAGSNPRPDVSGDGNQRPLSGTPEQAAASRSPVPPLGGKLTVLFTVGVGYQLSAKSCTFNALVTFCAYLQLQEPSRESIYIYGASLSDEQADCLYYLPVNTNAAPNRFLWLRHRDSSGLRQPVAKTADAQAPLVWMQKGKREYEGIVKRPITGRGLPVGVIESLSKNAQKAAQDRFLREFRASPLYLATDTSDVFTIRWSPTVGTDDSKEAQRLLARTGDDIRLAAAGVYELVPTTKVGTADAFRARAKVPYYRGILNGSLRPLSDPDVTGEEREIYKKASAALESLVNALEREGATGKDGHFDEAARSAVARAEADVMEADDACTRWRIAHATEIVGREDRDRARAVAAAAEAAAKRRAEQDSPERGVTGQVSPSYPAVVDRFINQVLATYGVESAQFTGVRPSSGLGRLYLFRFTYKSGNGSVLTRDGWVAADEQCVYAYNVDGEHEVRWCK